MADHDDDKKAYLASQKKRNLAIGLSLGAFVILVFIVSLVRMAEGVAAGH
ncbi:MULTISPECIES: hypothetical protein [Asticcacaulis]|uniref:Cytochrome C oxidase assembly protein n=1 Tax=Asticcacaulis endophyticus TaxID=1395890 RepID=A0A918Q8U5_9CAUL|nr:MULTISPECIES: hypothetical protein [Asticcacaulis]WKL56803.1 hypothetical protein Q1W73_14165 [Asticcacaulis sp. ZE23SCel15]GGZ37171.1 hypothetical protein GCM10011273_24430 [Asticcacaulis endophyticus]